MELNRCRRCGAFFVSDSAVCPNCEPKDTAEIFKLKDFLAENDCPDSIEGLACTTGISLKNLNRFLEQEDFSEVISKFDTGKGKNINIKL